MLLQTNLADIPQDCQFLLEIEATPRRRKDILMEMVSYWILAMNGALAEMKHKRRREQQARRRGETYKKTHWNIVSGVREAYAARKIVKAVAERTTLQTIR
jgi:hypothetical protein